MSAEKRDATLMQAAVLKDKGQEERKVVDNSIQDTFKTVKLLKSAKELDDVLVY
jgi:hypothetical protein